MLKGTINQIIQLIGGLGKRAPLDGVGTSNFGTGVKPGIGKPSDEKGEKGRPVFVTVMEASVIPVAIFVMNIGDLSDTTLRDAIRLSSLIYIAVVYFLSLKYPKVSGKRRDTSAEDREFYAMGWVIVVLAGIPLVALLIFVLIPR